MKSLLLLAIVAALAVVTLCYESHESMESYEISPFINRRNANTFMSPQQRWRAKAQERVRERTKPAYEINREACDDFKLCERYALMYGYNAAYNRYFRQRRGTKWDGRGDLFCFGAWSLVLYPPCIALLKYIDTYMMLVFYIISCLAAPRLPDPRVLSHESAVC